MTRESPSSRTRDDSPRRALITGASAGIGEAFAERLAADGWDLVVVARRGDRLEGLSKRLNERHGSDVEVLPADLTRTDELRSVEGRIASDASIELLVNNAGFASAGPVANLDPDREESKVCLNVLALVRLTRAALPGMIARSRGGVINVSSMSAFIPAPYMATYAATKAFINHFTEALHEELRGSGVRVQALCPGLTRTEFQVVADLADDGLPGPFWMEAQEVVDASLKGLQRGSLIVVPGLFNRTMGFIMKRNVAPQSCT